MKAPQIVLFILLTCHVQGQESLQGYIDLALAQSDVLKKQQVSIEKASLALQEAKLLFRPTSTLSADYFVAVGGRTVDFPIGDILNPVYSTLNQLTQSNQFPQLENQSILLNPNNFYDVKVRTAMPLINSEIKVAQRIKDQQIGLEQTEITRYTRELTHDVKAAYYHYLKAQEAIKIYQTAIALAEEGLRTNQSLFRNDKVNRTAVVRAEQEVVKYKSQVESAQQNAKNTQAYFNFLVNRKLTESIDTTFLTDLPDATVALLADRTIENRAELKKLSQANTLNRHLVDLARASNQPKLNAFVDLGAQNFNFKVNRQTPYLFGGLSLKWDIYTSGRSDLKIKQANLDVQALEIQTHEVRNKLNLQVQIARNDYAHARAQYTSSLTQVVSAERYHQDMQRLFREGMALYIELLDAQNQLIINRLQANLAKYDLWIKASEIERAVP